MFLRTLDRCNNSIITLKLNGNHIKKSPVIIYRWKEGYLLEIVKNHSKSVYSKENNRAERRYLKNMHLKWRPHVGERK